MGEVIPYEDREDAKAHGVKLNSLGQVKGNATTPKFTRENLRKADEWKKGRARKLQKQRQEYFKKIEDEIYKDVEDAYETANKYANVLNKYSDKPSKTTNRTGIIVFMYLFPCTLLANCQSPLHQLFSYNFPKLSTLMICPIYHLYYNPMSPPVKQKCIEPFCSVSSRTRFTHLLQCVNFMLRFYILALGY